jgi:hypothetical protein
MGNGLLPLLCLVAACASARKPVAPERVDLARAEELVRAEIFRENPQMNPAAQFPLFEIENAAAWESMSVQLFQVGPGATTEACETFALRHGQVARLGTGFGGMGVGSTLVSDLDADGSPDLLFVYSWGSGRHRSQVGMLSIAGGALRTLPCEWSSDGDVFLVAAAGKAQLWNAQGPFASLRFSGGALSVVAE